MSTGVYLVFSMVRSVRMKSMPFMYGMFQSMMMKSTSHRPREIAWCLGALERRARFSG
jgi:hypothetical protein